jgi:hypothetical protein
MALHFFNVQRVFALRETRHDHHLDIAKPPNYQPSWGSKRTPPSPGTGLWLCQRALILAVWSLAACSPPSIQDALQTYTSRLQAMLDIESLPMNPVVRPSIDRRQRHIDLESVQGSKQSLGLLDYLSLNACALHQVLSEQNNSLGRWADPIGRLEFQLRFIELAPACIDTLKPSDPDLAQVIERALATKRGRLALQIERSILYSDELMTFWQPGRFGSLEPEGAHTEAMALASLLELSQHLKSGASTMPSTEIYKALQPLRSGLGGQIIEAWADVLGHLAVAERTLAEFTQDRPLCYQGMPNARAKQLEGLIIHVFAGTLQQEINRLTKMTQLTLPLVDSIEATLLTGQTPQLEQFRRERSALIQSARERLKGHAEDLSKLLGQCGLAPGGANSRAQNRTPEDL